MQNRLYITTKDLNWCKIETLKKQVYLVHQQNALLNKINVLTCNINKE